MRRQVIKITALGVLSVVLAAAVVVAAFYVRLSQGPVSLDFMTGTIKGSDSDGVMPLAPADAQRDETLADSAPTAW